MNMRRGIQSRHAAAHISAVKLAACAVLALTCTCQLRAQLNVSRSDVGAILASVNGKPVTLFEVLTETMGAERRLAENFSGPSLQNEIAKLRKQAVDDIIDRELVSGLFEARGYTVPDQVVENMINAVASDLAGGDRRLLESQARRAGISMDSLREQARTRAAAMMFISAKCYRDVFITPKQVHDYYVDNKREFRIPGRIRLQALYLKTTKDIGTGNIEQFALKLTPLMQEADEQRFNELVSKYSVGVNIDDGGDMGWVKFDMLREEFSVALQGRQAGSVVGPVKTPEGYYFLRVKDLDEDTYLPFQEVRERIRENLEEQQKQANYDRFVGQLRARALIQYFGDADKSRQPTQE